MSNVPDAWDDEWSAAADTPSAAHEQADAKKVSSKVTKAQKRAQQAEFNRQLWAEAEGPKETNYFVESRNVVPLRSEFKPPTVLLSRKGPVVQSRKPPTDSLGNLDLNKREESSGDEEDIKDREKTLAERQALAAKDREERQRKYEERRQELFGTPTASATANVNGRPTNPSGNSSPQSLTPPGSRSSTPSRGRGRGGRRGGNNSISQAQGRSQQQRQSQNELYDPSYSPKPDVIFSQRRENAVASPKPESLLQPTRTPKGPDGSGRGGFGFVARGGKPATASNITHTSSAVDSPS